MDLPRDVFELTFRGSGFGQLLVQSLLEIVDHQPVLRIGQIELLERTLGGVVCRLYTKPCLLYALFTLRLLQHERSLRRKSLPWQ